MSSTSLNVRIGLNEAAFATLVSAVSKHAAIDRAIVYGSRAKGNFREGSDIDLTLDANNLCEQDFSSIWHELEESSLPYLIDLSKLQDLQNTDLLEHIHRVGIVIYERSKASHSEP